MPDLIITSVERLECDDLEQAVRVANNYKILEETFGVKYNFDFSEFDKEAES